MLCEHAFALEVRGVILAAKLQRANNAEAMQFNLAVCALM